jgi:hypothetical protein
MFANGSVDPFYSLLTTYHTGDRMIYTDGCVYEAQRLSFGSPPTISNQPDYWIKVNNDFRGVRERIKYNSQKIVLEFVLNKFFRLTFRQPDSVTDPQTLRSYIYIDNNNLNNQVFVTANDEAFASVTSNGDDYAETFVMNDYSFDYNAFTIYVPDSMSSPVTGWYSSLGAYAEQKIRAVADLYVIAGIKYNIVTY